MSEMSVTFILLYAIAAIVSLQDSAAAFPTDEKETPLPNTQKEETPSLFYSLSNEEVKLDLENDTNMVMVGDMRLTKEQFESLIDPEDKRKATVWEGLKWPREGDFPTLVYTIEGEGETYRNVIAESMAYYEDHTCIRFRQKTDEDKSFVRIYQGTGCSSSVGRLTPRYPQKLSLGKGCHFLLHTIHEIGHALGLKHEQMRHDRDEHIQVMLEKVKPKKEVNFAKVMEINYSPLGAPFDFTSVMMYEARSFSIDGSVTMISKNPFYLGLMGRGRELSHWDKVLVNKMYGCLEDWLNTCKPSPEDNCLNGGYLGHNCICVCPPGTKGNRCELVKGSYYDDELSPFNQLVNINNTVIESPFFPYIVPGGIWSVHEIVAPEDHFIQVKFLRFAVSEYIHDDSKCHRYALVFLEYKLDNKRNIAACGNDIVEGEVFSSITNELVLFYDTKNGTYGSGGFSALVYFVHNQYRSSTTNTTTTTTNTTTTSTTTTKPTTSTTTTTTPKTTTKPSTTTRRIITKPLINTNSGMSLKSGAMYLPFLFALMQMF